MDILELKGFGKKRIENLNEKGIFSTRELVDFLPTQYQDMQQEVYFENLVDNQFALIRGVIKKNLTTFFKGKINITRGNVELSDGGKVIVIWYNMPYVKRNITIGEEYLFYGKIKKSDKAISMFVPQLERASIRKKLQGIVPKYPKIEKISSALISSAEEEIIKTHSLKSIIPISMTEKYNLMNLHEAYSLVHFPKSIREALEARDRIVLEIATKKMLSFKLFNNDYNYIDRYKKIDIINILKNVLPYELYSSQKKALNEIVDDMMRDRPMNRLLQGDVGSGKSVVILASAIFACLNGFQSAILAPTMTLAHQHFDKFKPICEKLNLKLVLLSNETKDADFVRDSISNGSVNIVIGTHALLSNKVTFKNLSFVAIDEQQKFGVEQRLKLINKGKSVDLLSATATPIPRSLALILYGEVNVSYIKKNKLNKINTYIMSENKLSDLYKFIDKKVEDGGLAYIVCPKIYDEEHFENDGAESKYNELQKIFKNRKVGLLHGGMKKEIRLASQDKFMANQYDILVSTSVIEVGIDNPRANIIVIFNADLFGLSSLHQLRGRVGRMGQESFCFLCVNKVRKEAKERLEFFKANIDGFKIADYDLDTRGSGNYYGNEQHGFSSGFNLYGMNFEKIKLASKIADEVLEEGALTSIEIKKLTFQSSKNIGRLN